MSVHLNIIQNDCIKLFGTKNLNFSKNLEYGKLKPNGVNSHAVGVRYCLRCNGNDIFWWLGIFHKNFDFKNGSKQRFKDNEK